MDVQAAPQIVCHRLLEPGGKELAGGIDDSIRRPRFVQQPFHARGVGKIGMAGPHLAGKPVRQVAFLPMDGKDKAVSLLKEAKRNLVTQSSRAGRARQQIGVRSHTGY